MSALFAIAIGAALGPALLLALGYVCCKYVDLPEWLIRT